HSTIPTYLDGSRGTDVMKRWQLTLALALACGPAAALSSRAAEPATDVSFDRDIQPLLFRCVLCHGPCKARGRLLLRSRGGARAAVLGCPGRVGGHAPAR